jgi:agmatinase
VAEGRRLGHIQFDSHPDLCDVYDGHKWSHACTARRVLEHPTISPDHLAFVGLRSYLAEETAFIEANPGIGVHKARDVCRRGIGAVATDVIAQMQGVDAIYFSLDIDGLDPAFAPGTGTPEGGGLSTRELIEFVYLIFDHLPIHAMDVVEVAPPLDVSDITSIAALKVIYEVFGRVKGIRG